MKKNIANTTRHHLENANQNVQRASLWYLVSIRVVIVKRTKKKREGKTGSCAALRCEALPFLRVVRGGDLCSGGGGGGVVEMVSFHRWGLVDGVEALLRKG